MTDHATHVANRQAAAAKLAAEVTAADLTAAAVTRVAKATTAQTPVTTVTIAPGAFRTRLKYEATGDNALRLLKEVSAWFIQHGYDASVAREVGARSYGANAYVLTVIDRPRREREAAELATRREEALRQAAAENPAATPAELAYDGGRTAQIAAELAAPAERITCGQCGEPVEKRWHADGGGSHWGHVNPALDGHPETTETVEDWGRDLVVVTREYDAAPTTPVTVTVELSGPDAVADTARHVTIEADRLERAFRHATPDASIRVTIANLRALAAALTADNTVCRACRYFTGHTSWCPLAD
jgi:hypothetical protein